VTKKAAAPTPASTDAEQSASVAAAPETTASAIASGPEGPQTADGGASTSTSTSAQAEAPAAGIAPLFQAPDPTAAPVRRRARKAASRSTSQPTVAEDAAAASTAAPHSDDVAGTDEAEPTEGLATGAIDDGVVERESVVDSTSETADATDTTDTTDTDTTDTDTTDTTDTTEDSSEDTGDDDADAPSRRRRRRGGRRRRRGGSGAAEAVEPTTPAETIIEEPDEVAEAAAELPTTEEEPSESGTTRRRRRRRRRGEGVDVSPDDPANTVVRVREPRTSDDEITAITGSTRLEAKKQRRREGRDAGRRRAPIVSESEFLARRESVKREMIVRQKDGVSQIAVLEDGVLVEHYVARESQTSLIGNVYLGRVQNVLPSMEAAFVDIGKGRNAVLYAGEVDWKALGVEGRPRKVEEVLKPGQTILVQVTKDPVGHKGARLTGQISLPGRYVVYVPGGQSSGISRKLSDTERSRLKSLLKEILPDEAGVIIRTAAEGATEEQLTRDVGALTARWEDITKKAASSGSAAQLLYGEPDLMIKVVRDLFNEDFVSLAVQGDDAWDMINGYVSHVAPDLSERLSRWGDGTGDHRDVFAAARIDEQIAKGLDRKVWLPSGGSLIIDRTEAMTVVDVNTGKFTGSGGNLEETVTKNNLEAAEEIVRQLRLRDIGGIIVIDFIDMVLENNRDLVLRRMVECLGRDRTRHQVAEVTSLGLVQMTRKKIGTGLLEAFSETCDRCHGRGLVLHAEPIEPEDAPAPSHEPRGRSASGATPSGDTASEGAGRRGRRGGRGGRGDSDDSPVKAAEVRPAESRYLGPRPVLEPKPPVTEPIAEHADAEPEASLAASATDGVGQAPQLVPDSTMQPTPTPTPEPVSEPAAEPVSLATASVEAPVATVVADVPAVAAKRPRRRASRPAAPPAPVPVAEPTAQTAPVPVAEPTAETAPVPAAELDAGTAAEPSWESAAEPQR
jgi:ribonuclease E